MNVKTRLGGAGLLACMFCASGCMVGPHYKRPPAAVPVAYKEAPPNNYKEADGWKVASPNDEMLKGKWWEIYKDPALNALEEQVAITNQNVLALEAQYREARAATRVARAALFPTVGTSPGITESRSGAVGSGNSATGASVSSLRTSYSFPLSASWAPDLWGSVRRNITAVSAQAQATAAQLENARLLYQSELAQDYFLLHGLDAQYALLNRALGEYQEYLTLTKNRFAGGIASDLDVAQAESQLYSTQAALQDLGILRAQYEHAIAVLTGRPPAELTIPALVVTNPPPAVPINVPSTLLERRPDIAAAERQMAAANEQIGIATAAFYPSLSLGASIGLDSSSFTKWFTWPSRFFSIGPTLSETIFEGGRRRAILAETQANFDITVADYRQTVLTAFQQVEDNLAALRVMADEEVTVNLAVNSAERALAVSTAQYKAGTTSYLTVITAQATALSAERTAVQLLTRRLTASVALVQALGGGWDASQLPGIKDVQAKTR
jgi:NodT family efflux transporter outer membrane factor (OMF) lipoprotein